MTDTDKLVAAIFAAAMCAKLGVSKHEDYLGHYDAFLEKIQEREDAAKLSASLAERYKAKRSPQVAKK